MTHSFYDVDIHGYLIKRFDDGRVERVPRGALTELLPDEPSAPAANKIPELYRNHSRNPLCTVCRMVRVSRRHFIRCHDCSKSPSVPAFDGVPCPVEHREARSSRVSRTCRMTRTPSECLKRAAAEDR